MKRILGWLGLLLWAGLLAGCHTNKANAIPTDVLTWAEVGQRQGTVVIHQPPAAERAAQVGDRLLPNGSVRTGADGRARMDLASGDRVYLGPNTRFTLQSTTGESPRLRLDLGKLWILLLQGAGLEVETPIGQAAVRGSYMGVAYTPQQGLRVTCLEGDCRIRTTAGEARLVAGQAAQVTAAQTAPQVQPMSEQDLQDWLQTVPESRQVVPTMQATRTHWMQATAQALTATPWVSPPEPTERLTPTGTIVPPLPTSSPPPYPTPTVTMPNTGQHIQLPDLVYQCGDYATCAAHCSSTDPMIPPPAECIQAEEFLVAQGVNFDYFLACWSTGDDPQICADRAAGLIP